MEINRIDFHAEVVRLKEVGMFADTDRVYFRVEDAATKIRDGLRYFLGGDALWLPEYDQVAEWLTDNQGRGLLCAGNVGRGKTVLCVKVLPCIIHYAENKLVAQYNARGLGAKLSEAMTRKLVCVDDIGTEGETVDFGNHIAAVPALIDLAERRGNLLMLTTNLSFAELKKKYGERTTDRLRAICKTVIFRGDSMRAKNSL